MNKEEFDVLVNDILKVPMEEPPVSAYGSININELRQVIEAFNKIPNYDELIKDNCKKDKEIERLNNIINDIDNIIRQMIYTGYYVYSKSPYEDFEGQTVTNYMATGESSEFGRRALVILDKLKALKEDKEWKRK